MAKFYQGTKGPFCTFSLNRNRRKFQLTKYDESTARQITVHIEAMEIAAKTGTGIPYETVVWLGKIDESLRQRLADAGLCDQAKQVTLRQLVDEFVAKKEKEVATLTYGDWERVGDLLVETLGDAPVSEVDEDVTRDARHKIADVFACSTLDKRLSSFKAFFEFGVSEGYIRTNPMDWHLGKTADGAEKTYVTESQIEDLIKVAPSEEWKRLLAISRYCGIRVPSEFRQMKWSHVDRENKWITIFSPKTRNHSRGEKRRCPFFRELQPHLVQPFDAKLGDYVFPMLRRNKSMYQPLHSMMQMLGREPWPRFFNSNRSSRITDLLKVASITNVARWVGNSPKVILQNYAEALDSEAARLV